LDKSKFIVQRSNLIRRHGEQADATATQGWVKRCHMHRLFRDGNDQLNGFVIDDLLQIEKVLVGIERWRSDAKRSTDGARSTGQMARIGFGNDYPPSRRLERARNIKRFG
jgi:hypothetical protein